MKHRENLLVGQVPRGTKENKRIGIEVRHCQRSFLHRFRYDLSNVCTELMPHHGQNPVGKVRVSGRN